MVEAHRNGAKRTVKVPGFFRDQIEHAQVSLSRLEETAEKTVKELLEKGKASRKDLEKLLVKLSKDDRLTELKDRLEKLQKTGAVRAEELRDRAETFRSEALERIVEFQGKAVSFLGVATREQVEELHRELDRLAKRFEKREKARPAKKASRKVEV